MNIKYSPIIITGMHRSGTTLLSKLLENNNVFMGRHKEINNESKYFLRINRWLLTTIGSSWDNPQSFDVIDKNLEKILINRIKDLLNSRTNIYYFGLRKIFNKNSFFNLNHKWGWKDPRNTFTIDLWKQIFPDAKILNISRHPLDISFSLLERQNKLIEKDKLKVNKFISNVARLLSISHSSVLSSTRINNINDCLILTAKYFKQGQKNTNEYSDDILNINYEMLVLDSENTIKIILEYCNIKINDYNVAKFIETINTKNAFKFKQSDSNYSEYLDKINYNV